MVQAARLDLTRVAAIGLLAALASPAALAQPAVQSAPLLQDRSLTTLLQPQRLDNSRPLLRPSGEGAGSPDAANRNTPCVRQGGAPATGAAGARPGAAPSVFGGGSGPGDYGRYLPNAPASSSTASATSRPAAPSTRNPGVDRPLYGGTDRPLWDTGDRRPSSDTTSQPSGGRSSGSQSSAGKPSQPSGATQAGGTPAPGTPQDRLPRDRPLWGDGSLMASTDPAAGAGTTPCVDPAPTTSR
ncbi:MAG: hypothetical protein ACRYF2_12735 [Janthinobacterium lividum]